MSLNNEKNKKICISCNYSCIWDCDMKRHMETEKHKKLSKLEIVDKKKHKCICGKGYSHVNGLYYHRKSCEMYITSINKKNNSYSEIGNNNKNTNICDSNIELNENIEEVEINQTTKIREDIVIIDDIPKNNVEEFLFKEIINMKENMNEIKNLIKNNTSQNITINNQQNNFNLTVFLNEHCKDALNMSEFIDTLDISPYTLQYTGEHGYAEGITKIFVDGLNELDVCKRPIHCTDLKRETLYIKENDTWEKDTENKDGLLKTIHIVADKNRKEMKKWQGENPKYDFVDTREYELHIHIMRESLGGGIKTKKNTRKIISNISRYTLINKSKYCVKKI